MQINNNETINPTQKQDNIQEIFGARSKRVKKVNLLKDNGQGMSDRSGTVFIPASESAYDRTVRLHEALHLDFTPRNFQPKDALDQGLEDARLHRYCANTKSVNSVRRDEISTALYDLRDAIKNATSRSASAKTSLVVLRAVAILYGETKYLGIIEKATNLISPDYLKKVIGAIRLSERGCNSPDWMKARNILQKYFAEEFKMKVPQVEQVAISQLGANDSKESGNQKLQKAKLNVEDESKDKKDSDEHKKPEESNASDKSEDESEKSEDKPKKSDSPKEDSDDSEDFEDFEDESESDNPFEEYDDSSDDFDTQLTRDINDQNSDETCDAAGGKDTYNIISTEYVEKPKKIKLHPDAYRGPGISKYDQRADEAERLQRKYPKQLIIHRLDNGNSSVPTIDGNRGRTASLSGCRIHAGKLAVAMQNGVRVFNRKRGEGGGAILIDNSGSMNIPEKVLINFAASLPLATIAFYSATNDSNTNEEGHLSIYAANGRRANGFVNVYGGYGNLVDYQAITWLLEQPGPRWYVGDLMFTGAWEYHCTKFFDSLVSRKLVTHVLNLPAMSDLLRKRK